MMAKQLLCSLQASTRTGMLIVVASIAASFPCTVAASEQAPPWSAPATTSVVQEEKVFHNAGAELSGTLYLPRGGKALGAVVVTHAASLPLRDHPLYRHLHEMLPSLGVAVFGYDRRGSGKSGGDLKAATTRCWPMMRSRRYAPSIPIRASIRGASASGG
jgi:hypothetical protein